MESRNIRHSASRSVMGIAGVIALCGAADLAHAGSASVYVRAKDSSGVDEKQGSESKFLLDAYVSRSASVQGVYAGAWGRGKLFSKQGGGTGYIKSASTTNKSFKWKWSASTTDFVIDGPVGQFAEINLKYLAIPGVTWPDDVGPPVDFLPAVRSLLLPAVQSFYAEGLATVDFTSNSFITMADGSVQTLSQGGATLGGPASDAPRLLATGDLVGLFGPMQTLEPGIDIPELRNLRNLGIIDADFTAGLLRLPTNTPMSWSMRFEATTNGDDPAFEPPGYDGPDEFGSGAFFDVRLELADDFNGTFALRAVPEPASLTLLGVGGLLLARRRR